jgi:inorganic triphosphatase YgiF
MSGGREVELKLAVDDAAALEAVAAAAGGARQAPAHQTNTFFDTPSLSLDAARCICRLREEGGRYTLTLKGPATAASSDGVVTSKVEEEWDLDEAGARLLLAGREDPLLVLKDRSEQNPLLEQVRARAADERLAPLGAFSNERTRIVATLVVAGAPRPAVLELDRTTFPGGVVEHEVELEIDDAAAADSWRLALDELFARAGVCGRPAASKAKRFFSLVRASRTVAS